MNKIFFILALLFLSSCQSLNTEDGTYNYPCAFKANELSEQSKEINQKMIDMGCHTNVFSDSVYGRCVELRAENQQIIREWESLACTPDSFD